MSQNLDSFVSPLLVQALQDLALYSQQAKCERWFIPRVNNQNIDVDILRLDKVSHPHCVPLSGNKLFKLLPNIACARAGEYSKLVSFGGRWSNHCWSLSAAIADLELSLDLFIRGERSLQLTPTLCDSQERGARLQFVPRGFYDEFAYRTLDELDKAEELCQGCDSASIYFIPSGGSNTPAVIGSAVLGVYLARAYPRYEFYCAAGTGGFALGVALGISLASFHSIEVSSVDLPKVIAPCVAGDRERVEERSMALLKSTLGCLKENRELLNAIQCDEARLIDLENSIGSYSASISEVLPLEYKDMDNQFGQPSMEQDEFRLGLEQANGELVDPVYITPLSVYLAQGGFERAVDRSRSVLLLHTGGQQGGRLAQ